MKRTISFLLILLLLTALLPAAVGMALTDGDYTYTVDGAGNATITKYNGTGGAITIPSTLGGYPVKGIEGFAFESTSVTSVVIPDGVTWIGDQAFAECNFLTSIMIPNSVTVMADAALANTGLTSIVLPAGMTNNIGDALCAGCTSLTSITLPAGITSLSNSMFQGCTSLQSVTIPATVTWMGECVFDDCTLLRSAVFEGAPPTISLQFRNCAPDFTIYYNPLYGTQWEDAQLNYNIAPTPFEPQLLGAQAYTDGSKFRFAFQVNVIDLQSALAPDDTLEIGYLVRSKTSYDKYGILSTVTLPTVTWTAEMDAAAGGTELKDFLYADYYDDGMRILAVDDESLTFALVLTGMSDKQNVDIVFSGYIKTSQITLRSETKYNSITKVLAQTPSTTID